MGVEVDEAQAGISFRRRAHRAEGHKMFTAEQNGDFVRRQDLRGSLFYGGESSRGVAEGQV